MSYSLSIGPVKGDEIFGAVRAARPQHEIDDDTEAAIAVQKETAIKLFENLHVKADRYYGASISGHIEPATSTSSGSCSVGVYGLPEGYEPSVSSG